MRRIVFIIIIVICLIFSGCIYEKSSNNKIKQKATSYFEYLIEIDSYSNETYETYVPVPLNANNLGVSNIYNNVKINQGDGTFELIETIHGKAIKIVTQGDVCLYANKKEKIPFAQLSLNNSPINIETIDMQGELSGFWIYLNCSSNNTISMNLSLYVWNSDVNTAIAIDNTRKSSLTILTQGWNIVDLEIYKIKP